MKRIVIHCLIVILLVASLTKPPSSGRAQNRSPHGRALLVGINRYAQAYVPPTPGAEEDALAMRDLIIAQYGFRADEVKMLLGPQATAAAIIKAFRQWLIAETQPGDKVFFHYSGHGSRVPDEDGDEADGYDEVLAPYDVALRDEQHFDNIILDDEIGRLLAQLPGREGALVFDSCNSGTITRGTAGASGNPAKPRYLPSPDELSRLKTATRGVGAVSYEVSELESEPGGRQLKRRDLKLVKDKLDDASARIAIFSAAQSGQSAYPIKVGNGYRGVLSYLFTEMQRERSLSFNELQRQITAEVVRLQSSGQIKGRQVPFFEVLSPFPLDVPLFAADKPGTIVAPAIAFANPGSAFEVSLRSREGKKQYRLNEPVSYEVTTNAPGWLYLLVFSQERKATCVFPNETNKDDLDNYVSRGTHRLPRSQVFYAQEPLGKDIVVALLSSVKLNLGDKEEMTWDEVFDRLRSHKLAGYVKNRGVGTKKTGQPAVTPSSLDDADWQAASLVIETVR